MADKKSLDDILKDIEYIGESQEEDSDVDSPVEELAKTTNDSVTTINSEEDSDDYLNSLITQDSPTPQQAEPVTYAGALVRGVIDKVRNKWNYTTSLGDTKSLITPGDRAGQLDTPLKSTIYSIGAAATDVAQTIIVGAEGAVLGSPGGPAGSVAAGAASIYGSATFNAAVSSAEVFKDAYNEALNRGYGETEAFWEAFEKSGATFGLEFLSNFVPFGKLGLGTAAKKVLSKPVQKLVDKGIIQVKDGIVKVLNKEAFKKAATGATTKQAIKSTAKKELLKTRLKTTGKEALKAAGEEGGEEGLEDIVHQLVEIANDPNKTLEDFDWESVWENAKGGAIAGGVLRTSEPHLEKGIKNLKQTKNRIKYGKKVSEDIKNIDDKTITINAREKTIEEAKRNKEIETAADKESLAITDLQNKITDAEGKSVSYTDINDDDNYIFRNKEGIEQSMSGKEAKQAWKKEYQKNKDIHKKQIIAREVATSAFNDLFSIKNNKGEDVTNVKNTDFNPEEDYTVTFGSKTETVSGENIADLREQYLEEVVSATEEQTGLREPEKPKSNVLTREGAQLLKQKLLSQNNLREFYATHKVIDLQNGEEVTPNNVSPDGRYQVVRNDGKIIAEDVPGLGVSMLEKYADIEFKQDQDKVGKRSPLEFNLDDSLIELANKGSGKIKDNSITITTKDGPVKFLLQKQVGETSWAKNKWNNLKPNATYRLVDSKGNVFGTYNASQIKAFSKVATRNAVAVDPSFIEQHKLKTVGGKEVSWDSLGDINDATRYTIEHNGTTLAENISADAALLYRNNAVESYITTKSGDDYINIKASSQYKGAPGTLYMRANDPTNTTYIGDNTDLLADTTNDIEREILTIKQKEDTRKAILKAIKEQQDNQSKASNEELNADEKGINIDHQAVFSGGANPETFAQFTEGEWSDDFIFSKPDTVVDSVATITRTLKEDHEKLLDIYGPTIKKIIAGTNTDRVSKEHIRTVLSNLAQKLGYKMLNDLDTKGMMSDLDKKGYKRKKERVTRVKAQVFGQMDAKRRYFRIRNSRDYFTGLHELGHGIFQDGLFGQGAEGVKSKLSATNDIHTFIKEMDILNNKAIKGYSEQQLDTSMYDPNKIGDAHNRIAEDIFSEAVMMLGTDENFEAKFKQYAPKTFEALDAYLTETSSWDDIKTIQKLVKAYKNQSSLDRAIADATLPSKTLFGQVFSPEWWRNVSLKQVWANILSHTTDDMASLRLAAKELGIKSGSEMPELYKSLGNDFAHRMLYGDGCNFAGQSLQGIGFVNLQETFNQILREDGKEGENTLASLLWAQQTLAAYAGDARVLTKLKQLSNKLDKQFTQVFSVMRNISNKNWDAFINKEDTKASDIKNNEEWEKIGLTSQQVADIINEFKHTARQLLTGEDIKEARKVLLNELQEIKQEQDDNIRLAKMEAWRENVLKEALRRNFKQTSLADVADTGLKLLDAIKIYDDILTFGDKASLYAKAANDYHNYQNALRNLVSGASSEMKFLMTRFNNASSDWYVPLLRYFDTSTEEPISPHYLMTTREGSDRPITNLFENTIKETVTLCNQATRSALKQFMIQMADIPGSGFYIRELNEPVAKSNLTLENLRETVFKLRDEKIQELKDRGIPITSDITAKVDALINELESLQIAAFDVFTPTQSLKDTNCEFSYFDPEIGQMRFFETEPGIYEALYRPTYSDPSALKYAKAAFVFGTAMMKLGLITINPVFLLWTNPIRDVITLSWKGDTPAIRTGNRFIDSNILNTLPGALWQVSKIYMDWVLNLGRPDSFKLMDYFGLGYNTRMNTWRNMQQNLNYKDKTTPVLSSNPLKAMVQIANIIADKTTDVIERMGSLDKLARLAQLKAMLERDGLVADNFDVNRRNVAAMVLEKQVLLSNGITNDIINNNLTDEQKVIWNNASEEEAPILNLTEDQIQKIYKEINPKDVHEFTPEQRMKYAKALRMCTTDFARGGTLLRGINRVLLFTQPAFNGTAQSVEILKERIATGHTDEVLANMLTAFASGIAAGYLFPDDEDETEDNLLKGITFKIGDTTIRAPGLPEDLVLFHFGRYSTYSNNKDYGRFIKAFINSINPFHTGQGPFGLALSLLTDKRLNDLQDTRFGQSIVPDYMKKQYGDKYPEMFYNESTSWLARTAGRFMMNPMKIQYIMDQTGLSVIDRMVENLMGVNRVTRTDAGIDLQNNSRRWRDFLTSFGINTKTFQTRSQLALQNMLDEASGDYYRNVPAEKRKAKKGFNREELKLRNNYLALSQINKTISIYNKLESIAQRIEDRDAIHKDKIAYMKNMVRLLEKVPGLEGKYYYQLSNLRRNVQRKLDWKERALSIQARKELKDKEASPGLLRKIWQETLGTKEANAMPFEGAEYWINQYKQRNLPGGKNELKENLINQNKPSNSVINTEIRARVPERTNSKGVKYIPNELQNEVREDINKTLKTNIDSAVEKTIGAIAIALERAGSPTRSSIRQLTVNEVLNNDSFKNKLKQAYKTPITFNDVSEAIAETLVEKTIKYPVTAKYESKGKLWSTKPESKKVTITNNKGVKKNVEVGGFGIYQLDPYATGGHEKMKRFINQSSFNQKLSEALDKTKANGIDYSKLSNIWQNISKDPITAETFAKEYESFMEKEYLPKDLMDEYKRAGFDINNRHVKDAIFAFSVQMPAQAKKFAKGLPANKSITNTSAINTIMNKKIALHPELSTRYNKEKQDLLNSLGD